MKHLRLLGIVVCPVVLVWLLVGCRKTSSEATVEPPWFEDVSEQVGLHFVHDAGPIDGSYFMPQIMGSGAALFDFDGDGLLDVLLLNNGGPKGQPNRLFKQQADGTFKDVSKGSGLDFAGFCMGVAIGDVNNDGLPDVLVTEYGGVRLFLNNGNGTFTDVTKESGLSNLSWATSAAFFDFDRDGFLDLVVVNYLAYDPARECHISDGKRDFCHPANFRGTASRLFRNLGKSGGGSVRFADVTIRSGLAQCVGPGLGVLCADFNGDGWPDVFIANDAKPNHLWINQKDGTFKEEAVLRNVAVSVLGQPEGNMGIAWGDVDGDGLQDLFVTHLNIETNTLWKQGPLGLFRDRTTTTGLHRPDRRETGFGTVFGDFDCAGSLDLALVNGAVSRAKPFDPDRARFWHPYSARNQLFVNDGRGYFRDLSSANEGLDEFSGRENVGRGLAVGDVANNGRLWLLATSAGGPARLYRNIAPTRGHWLGVRAYDPVRKRDAIGAEVIVKAGKRSWIRTAQAGGSYLCSSDPRTHFGLGQVEHVDGVTVRWPDGSTEDFGKVGVNRYVQLSKGHGKPVTKRR